MKKKLLLVSLMLSFSMPILNVNAEDTIEGLEHEIKTLQEKLDVLKAEKYQEYAQIEDDEPIATFVNHDLGLTSIYDIYLFELDGEKSLAIVARYDNDTLYSYNPSLAFMSSFYVTQYDDDGNNIRLETNRQPNFINPKDYYQSDSQVEHGESIDFEHYLKLRSDTNPIVINNTLGEEVVTIELEDISLRE